MGKLQVTMDNKELGTVNSLAIQRGFNSTASYIRALIARDVHDPIVKLDEKIIERAMEAINDSNYR